MILIDDKAENVDKAMELGSGGLHVEGKDALEWADLSTYVLVHTTGSQDISPMSVSSTPTSKTSRFGFGATRGGGMDVDMDYDSFSSSSFSSFTSSSSSTSTSRQQTSPKGSAEGDDGSGCQPCIVCKQIATKRCARCHGAYYCSPDCQRRDWSSHKPRCFPSTMDSS